MNNKHKHKKHPRAELIKAWADGEQIQYRSHEDLWVDCDTMPNWDSDSEYRIKPEEPSDKLWKPKKGEKYFYLDVINGEVDVNYYPWKNDEIYNALYRLHNIFHTEEEAKAAIPCVEDAIKIALKGGDSFMSKKSCLLELEVKDAEIEVLKKKLEALKKQKKSHKL